MEKNNRIEVGSISGFPEHLPAIRIIEMHYLDVFRDVFESYGYTPIETASVERPEVLYAKNENSDTAHQIYGLKRLNVDEDEDDGKDLALHFDLTVPLARYVVQNFNELQFPFRRYQMQKVWRGERKQKARYREFYQCDIDIIGNENLDPLYDAEMPAIVYEIFKRLDIGEFIIRISNRKIMNGFLESYGLTKLEAGKALSIIDNVDKTSVEDVLKNLQEEIEISDVLASDLCKFLELQGERHDVISYLQRIEGNSLYSEGLNELEKVCLGMEALGVPQKYYVIDMKIIRGLDYYTGTVYETSLLGSDLGSPCSGGRYDNLASSYTHRKMPGVGICIGLSRLIAVLLENDKIKASKSTLADCLVCHLSSDYISESFSVAKELRDNGINIETYLSPKKLRSQFNFAEKKGIRYAILIGEEEFNNKEVSIRDVIDREQETVKRNDLVNYLQKKLKP